MIFLTVGNELPFSRLVKAVDTWCLNNSGREVFGQIGEVGASEYRPRNFRWEKFLQPEEYHRMFSEAELIVGHAGTGTIITGLVMSKPVLVMARRAALREHRNDHQVATLERFASRKGIFAAEDDTALTSFLDQWERNREHISLGHASSYAEPRLIETIRTFIFKD